MEFNDSLPEAIRGHEAFKGIENLEGLAVAFHAGATKAPPTFEEMLGDEYKESPVFKDTKDLPSLLKQHVDLNSHLGNALRVPSENASDDDRKAFAQKVMEKVPSLMFKPDGADAEQMELIYRSLGKPEAADGYKLAEGIEVNAEMLPKLAEIAHKYNLNNEQLSGVVGFMKDLNTEMTDGESANAKEDAAALATKWGSALDEKKGMVIKLAEQTKAPAHLLEALKKGEVGSETYEWLDSLVTALTGGEGVNFTDDGGASDVRLTPSEAKSQIDEIYNNPAHPFRDAKHPGHQDWIKPGGKMTELQKMATPPKR